MEIKNRTLSNFAELVRTGECKKFRGRLKVGVDLGTANTVLAVVDSTNRPIAGVSAPSHAIRDGVIVNYYEIRSACHKTESRARGKTCHRATPMLLLPSLRRYLTARMCQKHWLCTGRCRIRSDEYRR